MSNEQAPDSCPFCGARIHVNRDGELIEFKCGNAWQKQWPEFRGLQSKHCITAERERLNRERDEAVKARNHNRVCIQRLAKERDDLRARVKRLEEALQKAVSAHAFDGAWRRDAKSVLEAKEATP